MSKSNRKVRYAVVGLGHLTQVAVLPAFAQAQNSEVVALVSDDPKKLSTLGRWYGAERLYSYDEYKEALANVDAAYIVLPNHLHREFTVRTAEAGVHVLCEKPMAATVKDCQAMIAAVRRHKRKLMIAYRLHFEKANLEAIAIARRKLGELRFFSSDFAQQVVPDNVRRSQPVSKGGGPIYDMGVYCINAARYLFGAEPVEVFAASASRRGFNDARLNDPCLNDPEEMTSVVLRFPEDRMATFTASFGAAEIGRYTLVGTKGTLTADPGYEYAEGINLEIKRDGKSSKREYPKRDQFAAEISYFSDCILKNKEPEPNGEEGMADVRVIEAIYRSARNGKVVRLEPFSRKQRPSLRQELRRRPHGMPETVHVESPSGEAA